MQIGATLAFNYSALVSLFFLVLVGGVEFMEHIALYAFMRDIYDRKERTALSCVRAVHAFLSSTSPIRLSGG